MIDIPPSRECMRKDIINFFNGVKLNKNVYYIGFYKKRNAEHIFYYLRDYFVDINEELCNASIAQKYYHIFHNIDEMPKNGERFINFVEGYTKGVNEKINSGRNLGRLIIRLNNMDIRPFMHFDVDQSKEILELHIRKSSYTALTKNTELLESIMYHTGYMTNCGNFNRIVYFYNNVDKTEIFCGCGTLRKFFRFEMLKTCGGNKCISSRVSDFAKLRDLSYLQTSDAKIKRVKSREWYKPTDECKAKLRDSNIKTWTKEYKKTVVENNRKNGVFERQSKKMKERILNGEITPKTTNRLNHKRLYSDVTGLKNYRSNWEVMFHEAFPALKYEKLRIKYIYKDIDHVYIVDFIDEINKIVYEIKPKSMCDDEKNKCKISAALIWCELNGYKFKIITENEFRFN